MTLHEPDLQTFLKALASETRQSILMLFDTSESLSVNQIAEAVGIGQSTASEHLAILRRAGVLTSTRSGKEVYYRADYAQMIRATETLLAYLRSCASG
ncbi:winged helix-turn-helix transcriptional regulator [Chloroflexia bacterium SDU3-3]|nr:winged helix-turn-helix transcriptional regulator [Chloroflexia bacterium SDU3-3]